MNNSHIYTPCCCFFSPGIQLAFESPNYTFSENTSVNEAVVRIIIENYSSLDIRNDVSVTVMAFPGTTNASQNGMQLNTNRIIISRTQTYIHNKRGFRILFLPITVAFFISQITRSYNPTIRFA